MLKGYLQLLPQLLPNLLFTNLRMPTLIPDVITPKRQIAFNNI